MKLLSECDSIELHESYAGIGTAGIALVEQFTSMRSMVAAELPQRFLIFNTETVSLFSWPKLPKLNQKNTSCHQDTIVASTSNDPRCCRYDHSLGICLWHWPNMLGCTWNSFKGLVWIVGFPMSIGFPFRIIDIVTYSLILLWFSTNPPCKGLCLWSHRWWPQQQDNPGCSGLYGWWIQQNYDFVSDGQKFRGSVLTCFPNIVNVVVVLYFFICPLWVCWCLL